MDKNKAQFSADFQKGFSSLFREMWMNLFQETINNMLLILVKKNIDIPEKENPIKHPQIDGAVKTLNDLMPLVPLLAALKNFGRPKSLVFISEAGQAVDLLEVKEIDQNEIFNQILDNLNSIQTKEKQNIN